MDDRRFPVPDDPTTVKVHVVLPTATSSLSVATAIPSARAASASPRLHPHATRC